jgi:hypothetical protein
MIPHLGSASEVFEPSDSDWVICIWYADGTVMNRRISPGRITEEQAISYAIASDGKGVKDATRIETRRASDRGVVLSGADSFIDRLRRLKA